MLTFAEVHVTAHAKHDPGGKSKPRWPAGSKVEARFSECGLYRWGLSEIWDQSLPLLGNCSPPAWNG